VDELRSV